MNDISKQLKRKPVLCRLQVQGPEQKAQDALGQYFSVPECRKRPIDLIEEARDYCRGVLAKRRKLAQEQRQVAAQPDNDAMQEEDKENRTPTPMFTKASELPRGDKFDQLWDQMMFDNANHLEHEEGDRYDEWSPLLQQEEEGEDSPDPYYGMLNGHDIDESELFCNE